MGEQPFDADPGQPGDFQDFRHISLGIPVADPGHSRINFDMYIHRLAGFYSCLGQLLRHTFFKDCRAEILPYDGVIIFFIGIAQDQDRLLDPGVSQLHALFYCGNRDSPDIG